VLESRGTFELASVFEDVSTLPVIEGPDKVLGSLGWLVSKPVTRLLDCGVGLSFVLESDVLVLNGEAVIKVELYCVELSEEDLEAEGSGVPVAEVLITVGFDVWLPPMSDVGSEDSRPADVLDPDDCAWLDGTTSV
jgi:hypothetical protein